MINIEYRSFAGGSPGQKLGRGHEAKGEGNWKVEQRGKLILVLIRWLSDPSGTDLSLAFSFSSYNLRNLCI